MSSATLYRLSGIVVFIGGGLSAIGTIGQLFNNDPLSPFWTPTSLATALGLLLILLGLPAVYTRQMKQAGVFGLVGFLLFFLACVQFGGGSGLADLVLLPWATKIGGLNSAPVTFILYFLVIKLLLLVGSILWGIAMLRAAVFPKGSAILLLIGGVLFILGGRVHVIPNLDFIGEILFFLSFVWLGFSLLALSRKEMEHEAVSAPPGTLLGNR